MSTAQALPGTTTAHTLCGSTCIPLTGVDPACPHSPPGVRKCSVCTVLISSSKRFDKRLCFPQPLWRRTRSMHSGPSIPGTAWQEAALWARRGLGPAPLIYGAWAKPLVSHQRSQSLKPMQKAVLDPKIRPEIAQSVHLSCSASASMGKLVGASGCRRVTGSPSLFKGKKRTSYFYNTERQACQSSLGSIPV